MALFCRKGSHRLKAVSQWLLDELYATEDDLSRATDSGYTRGCTIFGRQKKRIIAKALSGRHARLGRPNSNNDIVFTIGGIPCSIPQNHGAGRFCSADSISTRMPQCACTAHN